MHLQNRNVHSDIQFLLSFVSFVLVPLTFISPPNRSAIFLFPTVSTLQRSSQRQVLLSHYLIIAAMEDHLFSL